MKKPSNKNRHKSWVDPDGDVWKIREGAIERAYCLHMRRGIVGLFAVAHADQVLPMRLHEPCHIIEVRQWRHGLLRASGVVTGSFARLIYCSSKGCGQWFVDGEAR